MVPIRRDRPGRAGSAFPAKKVLHEPENVAGASRKNSGAPVVRHRVPIRLLAALAVATALAAALRPAPPRIGATAPDFTLIDQNGKRVSLSEARGQKSVIVFYRGYW